MRRNKVIAVILMASMCLVPAREAAGGIDGSLVSENETVSDADMQSSNVSEDQISGNISEDLVSSNVSGDQVSDNVSENVSENEGEGTSLSDADAEETVSGDDEGTSGPNEKKRTDVSRLQIPERMNITMDPLEVEGRGQIYSDEYVIRNDGESAGTLMLYDLSCQLQEGSPVIVRKDKQGLHEGEEPFVYMEIVFGDDDRVTLTQKGAKYKAKLGPGEGLPLRFTGELNENASREWQGEEITVSMSYSWKAEDKRPEEAQEEEEKNIEAEESPEEEVSENTVETEEEGLSPTEEPETADEQETEVKVKKIALSEISPEMELSLNSWKTDEEGDTESVGYTLWNDGDTAGVVSISGPVCGTDDTAESVSENNDDSLSCDQEGGTDISLAIGDAEGVVISSGSADYEMRLGPGEEIPVRFVRKINGTADTTDEQDDEVIMILRCSWEMAEVAYELENEEYDVEEASDGNDGTRTDPAGG